MATRPALDIEVKADCPELFSIIGSLRVDSVIASKWDYAYCKITEDNYIEIGAAGGAVLDKEHALLFAARLKEMAERLPKEEPNADTPTA